MEAAVTPTERQNALEQTYAYLMSLSQGGINADLVAKMLASKVHDIGDMPARLGLDAVNFKQLMTSLFPQAVLPEIIHEDTDMDPERLQEREELQTLLSTHAADDESSHWMAEVVMAGCMGGDHLWQDLGLWSRKDLSLLMETNFPELAAKNDRDMKWKKFLYKQLCIQEGIYTCRSPSCEVCPDYQACFGPED